MSRDKPLISVWGVPGGRGERVPCNPSRGRPLTDSQKKRKRRGSGEKKEKKGIPPRFASIYALAHDISFRAEARRKIPLSLSLFAALFPQSLPLSLCLSPFSAGFPSFSPLGRGWCCYRCARFTYSRELEGISVHVPGIATNVILLKHMLAWLIGQTTATTNNSANVKRGERER